MKRLDVTIQSFLWGEKGQGKEGEIVAAIKAQRDYLSELPSRYNVRTHYTNLTVIRHKMQLNSCIIENLVGLKLLWNPRMRFTYCNNNIW